MIPKTLSVNAAKDSTDLVAKLRAYHNAAQTASLGDPKKALANYGLDLMKGEVRDNIKAGVLEPTVSKVRSLKSALEAATSLLRIDDGTCFFVFFFGFAFQSWGNAITHAHCLFHSASHSSGTGAEGGGSSRRSLEQEKNIEKKCGE